MQLRIGARKGWILEADLYAQIDRGASMWPIDNVDSWRTFFMEQSRYGVVHEGEAGGASRVMTTSTQALAVNIKADPAVSSKG